MAHYKSNVRDLCFNLFEFLDIAHTSLGKGPFADVDEAMARDALAALEKVAVSALAESFVESDRVPLVLDDNGDVHLPEGLKRSLAAYFDHDLHLLALPRELGGLGAPPTLTWASFELLAGANPTAAFYLFSTFIGRIIDRLGTPSQRARYVSNLVDKRWGGTMVLTEPDAGSDVGAGRAKARHVKDDVWEIEGVKRFITNGDFDGAPNVVHLVLARPEGAGPGTKGLSLFIVPKFWVDENGNIGERNGVVVSNIEKKMGLKGSATAELTFGERIPARGLLVGEVHDGIRQMFHVIEHARMAVGVKSMATLSTAYLNALSYTRERVQGADLMQAHNKTAPRVVILKHPDVRRMLMTQKAFAEGLRALDLWVASLQDSVELAGGHGHADAKAFEALNELMLPLVKGYASEKVYELLSLSLQCYGGSGYTQDYPIEQYIRDQKIDSLYEGTTHIQALDLLLRKMARDGGKTLFALQAQMKATVEGLANVKELDVERAALGKAVDNLGGMFGALLSKMGESLYHVGLNGNRALYALAEVVIGWLLIRHAEVALRRREQNPSERAFYDGKLASARWYARNVLPGITLARKLVEESTLDLMSLDDESF